ncbi:DNA sulfur modification protein DndB [Vibrio coralliilyticus]|uniref:DNA sulfur modification protein DndB n=1 Tax=Vibrio coralliilyticus TaxID=190893 RepID=UPI0015608F7B|nr:DNA sulfur modification protein DndB [Vibrio coralliilyticus]NRF14116.1 hypothetical protein [Vibrio coralliilyticus]
MDEFIFDDIEEETIKWEHEVIGTKGQFWSAAGSVDYVLTNAKLSLEEHEPSEKLTRQLFPVRELLDFSKMDFDQLLQRDLDDHRVATELIPYLLENAHEGLSFFPPIVAAILPFRKTTPKPVFDDETDIEIEKHEGAFWKGKRSGKAYKYQDLVNSRGVKAPFPLSRLSWNEGGARLVVLDGQHRAMAMLAIARTITDSWKESGEKYKYFYEARVQEIIKQLGGKEWLEENISKIEFPVCILKFSNGESLVDQHDSARKLFVDVNQNARRPSESRIILLSDNDLLNIFTRKTLNKIRTDKCSFPIYGIEYDYPGSSKKQQSSKPIKWSAIANIEMLRDVVLRTTFGPTKFIDDVNLKISGKPNWTDKNRYMRESLNLSHWFPREVEYEGQVFERNKIKKDYFPKNYTDKLIEKYMESWGDSILIVFEKFIPFKAHSDALTDLLDNWSTVEVHASLAKEAISQGQGMYWTLKDSYEHWKEYGKKEIDDTSRAWEAIGYKKTDFESLLSKYYLGSDSERNVENTKQFFDLFNTYASFVGLFLSFASIAKKQGVQGTEIPQFVSEIVARLNYSLQDNKGKLKLFLLRDVDHPINRIKGMDKPDATYFRYFWLELLYFSKTSENISDSIDFDKLKELLSEARVGYYQYLANQNLNIIKSNVTNSDWVKNRVNYSEQAKDRAKEQLQKSLKKWFGYNKSLFDEWSNIYLSVSDSNEQEGSGVDDYYEG